MDDFDLPDADGLEHPELVYVFFVGEGGHDAHDVGLDVFFAYFFPDGEQRMEVDEQEEAVFLLGECFVDVHVFGDDLFAGSDLSFVGLLLYHLNYNFIISLYANILSI